MTRSHLKFHARVPIPANASPQRPPPSRNYGVDLKRVPPKSRPAVRQGDTGLFCSDLHSHMHTRLARTPPSTFLFLPIHLSNSPGRIKSPLRSSQRADEAIASDLRRWQVTGISEELRRRAIPPNGGAPCRRFICRRVADCQPYIREFSPDDHKVIGTAAFCDGWPN